MEVLCKSSEEALDGVLRDGISIMSGGFGVCGIPENLIKRIYDSGVKNLTIISNNCGLDNIGLGLLLKKRQIKKLICSYLGGNKMLEQALFDKTIQIELVPQGVLAERIRAAGAGIPAFYSNTGVGTVFAKGKEKREFRGKLYLLIPALHADLAIIKGWKADKMGNIIYNKTANNFNGVMATAASTVVCEVEEIVEIGDLDPNHIHTPSIYIHRLLKGTHYDKPIEKLTVQD